MFYNPPMHKILLVMAHPDDESFLPGGTIAKYASEGVEIHLLCATRGENGQWSAVAPDGRGLGEVREREHREAVKILGIKQLDYLDLIDGEIKNQDIEKLVKKVKEKIKVFKPDVLLTLDLGGISGHLDHIAMAIVATKAFEDLTKVKKLYYYVRTKDQLSQRASLLRRNIVREDNQVTTRIDISKFVDLKIKAAMCHQTQMKDVQRNLSAWKNVVKEDCFILAGSRVETELSETDLFAGIG